jgi:photosystem II stability/assembly factor-like uncharacterized protein
MHLGTISGAPISSIMADKDVAMGKLEQQLQTPSKVRASWSPAIILGTAAFAGMLLAGSYIPFSKALSPHTPNGRIDGIVFDSPAHGYIQVLESPRATYETNDGGKTWKPFRGGTVGFRRGRSFASGLRGWSIDEELRDHGKVFQSDDGGVSWRVVFGTKDVNDFVFGGIQAISDFEVWVTGLSGTYRSEDGGKTWQKRGEGGTGLQFLDSKRGWVEGNILWHTDDGGVTWEGVGSNGKTCFGGFGFFFLNDHRGWAVGGATEGNMEGGAETGFLTESKDGGRTCEETRRIPGQFFWSVFFLNEREGWLGGIGSVLKTEDGGRTWALVYGQDAVKPRD